MAGIHLSTCTVDGRPLECWQLCELLVLHHWYRRGIRVGEVDLSWVISHHFRGGRRRIKVERWRLKICRGAEVVVDAVEGSVEREKQVESKPYIWGGRCLKVLLCWIGEGGVRPGSVCGSTAAA